MAKQMKKLERKNINQFVDFDETPSINGTIKDYREITTKFGAGMVIDLEVPGGEPVSVMETAGLKGYEWEELVGSEVTITAVGWEKSKNGRMRTFEVYA